jgi:phosphoglycolate phosphatase
VVLTVRQETFAVRLIMFDMDGTLIDTHALIHEHMGTAFVGAGLNAPTHEESRRIIGLSLPIAVGRLAGSEDPVLIETLVESYKRNYRAALTGAVEHEPLFPGAQDALDRLRAEPDTVLGVATGKELVPLNRILALHGLTDYFTTLQTPDHSPSKPHPGMLLRAMKEAGAKPQETVMIGDTTFDMELGKAAGVATVGVAWGYHDPAELVEAGAHAMIGAYEELDEAIERVLR